MTNEINYITAEFCGNRFIGTIYENGQIGVLSSNFSGGGDPALNYKVFSFDACNDIKPAEPEDFDVFMLSDYKYNREENKKVVEQLIKSISK